MTQYTQLSLDVVLRTPVAGLLEDVIPDSGAAPSDPKRAMNALWRLFNALGGQLRAGRVRARADSVTDYAASITLAVTQANIAVGEYIDVVIPGRGSFRITAVAADPDVTLGQFVSETDNATTATNMAAAIDGMIGLKDLVDASTNSGNLIITSRILGTWGNSLVVIDGTTNGITGEGSFSGGLDATTQVTSQVVLTHANITAGDTLSIGCVTLTWAASAANENEVTIGADATEDGDNLVEAIEGHSKLQGMLTAVNTVGTVVVTHHVPHRMALHFKLATSDATAMAVTQPTTNLTLAAATLEQSHNCGL